MSPAHSSLVNPSRNIKHNLTLATAKKHYKLQRKIPLICYLRDRNFNHNSCQLSNKRQVSSINTNILSGFIKI